MKEEYDFSNAIKNPYIDLLKKQVTINIDAETAEYFKEQAKEMRISFQKLINLYLADCAKAGKKVAVRKQQESTLKIS